jgi:hypothetical protein
LQPLIKVKASFSTLLGESTDKKYAVDADKCITELAI